MWAPGPEDGRIRDSHGRGHGSRHNLGALARSLDAEKTTTWCSGINWEGVVFLNVKAHPQRGISSNRSHLLILPAPFCRLENKP